MNLTAGEQELLAGKQGRSMRKAMEILVALGTIYGAESMLPVTSVQVAGVSYANLGEAGLSFLAEMAAGGGKASPAGVFSTLNPAGMDIDDVDGEHPWENGAQRMGIDAQFARNQQRVIEAFARMGITTTCTCTPYLVGNVPHYGEHIAWAESSAVCYANSVLGARSNREGGPSALAAALTGCTPAYGYHLDQERCPVVTVRVAVRPPEDDRKSMGEIRRATQFYGALGKVIGEKLALYGLRPVPYILGFNEPGKNVPVSLEELKSFCASIATYGGTALFHMAGVTPEAALYAPPRDVIDIEAQDIEQAITSLNEVDSSEVDFVSLGCPHLSLVEIAHLAELLRGKKVVKEFWITTSRPVRHMAERMGYVQTIEASGAKFAVDTCCVVAPIQGRFKAIATDSAKACYYASSKNKFKTMFKTFEQVVAEAIG